MSLNVDRLVAARNEYSTLFKKYLSPRLMEGFVSIWENAIEKERKEDGYSYISRFQSFLKEIPRWNQNYFS